MKLGEILHETATADVVMTFHGTVETDDKIVAAATKTLEETKKLASIKNILCISVAYPEENPDAYTECSLLTHLRGFKSRILFTHGMSDAKIQLR